MMEFTPVVMEGFVDIFRSFDTYVAVNVLLFLAVGAAGARSMAVGAFGGYLAFAWLAINANMSLYTNIFYVTLTLIMVGFGFKIVRLEAFGDGG